MICPSCTAVADRPTKDRLCVICDRRFALTASGTFPFHKSAYYNKEAKLGLRCYGFRGEPHGHPECEAPLTCTCQHRPKGSHAA